MSRHDFKVGDEVQFIARGELHRGKIFQINGDWTGRSTVDIDCHEARWFRDVREIMRVPSELGALGAPCGGGEGPEIGVGDVIVYRKPGRTFMGTIHELYDSYGERWFKACYPHGIFCGPVADAELHTKATPDPDPIQPEIDRLRATNDKLLSRVNELTRERNGYKDHVEWLRDRSLEASDEIERLKAERAELARDVGRLTAECDSARGIIAVLNDLIDNLVAWASKR